MSEPKPSPRLTQEQIDIRLDHLRWERERLTREAIENEERRQREVDRYRGLVTPEHRAALQAMERCRRECGDRRVLPADQCHPDGPCRCLCHTREDGRAYE